MTSYPARHICRTRHTSIFLLRRRMHFRELWCFFDLHCPDRTRDRQLTFMALQVLGMSSAGFGLDIPPR
jgi:hypothetical protein